MRNSRTYRIVVTILFCLALPAAFLGTDEMTTFYWLRGTAIVLLVTIYILQLRRRRIMYEL